MMQSMTGFGRSVLKDGDATVTVEMKTVNHRFLEMNIRIPKQYTILEEGIRKIISDQLQRGRVEVYITVEGGGLVKKHLQVDWDLFEQYFSAYKEAEMRVSTSRGISAYEVLRSPEVFSISETEAESEVFEQMLMQAVEEAVGQLRAMREREGKALKQDIINNLNLIEENHKQISQLADNITEKLRAKYLQRLEGVLEGNYDEQRIYLEIAVLAEKCDVHEEISRLSSHFSQFKHELEKTGPVGRKLDFIVQEMNREVNTIGSKANDVEITKMVIEIKSLVEKIREQVQNVE